MATTLEKPPIGTARAYSDASDGGVLVEIAVPDIDRIMTVYGSTGKLQIQSASSATGSYSDVITVALAAGVNHYEYAHAAGTTSTWYRYRYETTDGSTTLSQWSDVFPGTMPRPHTLQTIRQDVAKFLGLYGSGTTTAAGSASTAVDTGKIDARLTTNAWQGGWIKLTGGTYTGTVAGISAYAPATGTFTYTPVTAGASGSGSTYELYREVSPTTIDQCINEALQTLTESASFYLTCEASRTVYPVPYWLKDENDVIGIWQRVGRGDTSVEYENVRWTGVSKLGYYFERNQQEMVLVLNGSLGANTILRVTARRPIIAHPDLKLTADSDTVTVELENVRILASLKVVENIIQGARTNEATKVWEKRYAKLLADWQSVIYDESDWRSVDWQDHRPPVWVS